MRILASVFVVVAAVVFHGSALAQKAPEPAVLAAALGLGMPVYWQVAKIEIQASVNDGDEISPQYRQRFTADVAPREDLFRLVDEVEPFKVIAAVTPAGKSYKLYGIGFSTLEKGQWATKLKIENTPEALGTPQSMFDGPVVVAGDTISQQAIEAFMQGRETAKALGERAARTAANADVLARLATEADAQEQALLKDSYGRRLEALKGRIDADLAGFSSAIDAMIADNRKTLAQLNALHEKKVAAAKARAETLLALSDKTLAQLNALHEKKVAAAEARAETLLALSEAKEESNVQDELAATLEALAAKRQRSVDLEAQAVETRIAAGKKRYDQLRTKLSSSDASEQMAAFDMAMSSQDEMQRRLALTAAFRSGNDDLQGAALAVYLSGTPQISISVAFKERDGETAGTYLQTLQITEADGASFAGKFATAGINAIGKSSGTIQGDTLSLYAQWPNDEKCTWSARINDQGTLSGQMHCANRNGDYDDDNPGGEGAVSF